MKLHALLFTLLTFFSACAVSGRAFAQDSAANSYIAVLEKQDSLAAISDEMVPLRAELLRASEKHHVPASLLAAFCQEESNFNPWAERSEPKYWNNRKVKRAARKWSKAHKGLPTSTTELSDRAKSMGLMQPMGEVAREQGFDSTYLSALFEPFNSIDQGAILLKKLLARYGRDTLAAISAYNAGTPHQVHGTFANARYVYRVSVAWRHYQRALDYAQTRQHSTQTPSMARDNRERHNDTLSHAAVPLREHADSDALARKSYTNGGGPLPARHRLGTRYPSYAYLPQSQGQQQPATFTGYVMAGLTLLVFLACLFGLAYPIWRHRGGGTGHRLDLSRSANEFVLAGPSARAQNQNTSRTLRA